MKQFSLSKLYGVFFIIVGVGYFGAYTNVWEFTIFFPGWWAFFIMLPAVHHMLRNGYDTMAMFWILICAYYVASINDFISFQMTWKLFFALMMILIGFRFLFGNRMHKKERVQPNHKREESNANHLRSDVYCGSRILYATGDVFSVKAQCICGESTIDLLDANIHSLSYIDLDCICGKMTLLVPEDIHFIVDSDIVLGSCDIDDSKNGSQQLQVHVSGVVSNIHLRCMNRSKTYR